jgi:hypothetical protein
MDVFILADHFSPNYQRLGISARLHARRRPRKVWSVDGAGEAPAMNALASEYCDQLKHNFKTLYAAFPPNEPLRLGDYGVMNGNTFVPIGQVSDLGIPVGNIRRIPERSSDFEFTTEGSVDVEFHPSGSGGAGVPVKAGLDISFSKKFSVFFTAAQCLPVFIEDQVSLGNAIVKLMEGKWQKKFVVVTSLLEAGATTIVVSGSDQSSISLEAASAAIVAVNLGDVTLNLSITSAKSVGYKVITQAGLTPLIGLSKIGGVLSESFGPYALGPGRSSPAPQLLPFSE